MAELGTVRGNLAGLGARQHVDCPFAGPGGAHRSPAAHLTPGWTAANHGRPVATDNVRRAVAQLKAGGLVVLYDERRDEGDLLAAAELTSSDVVTQMVHQGGGLVCVALTPQRARALALRSAQVRRAEGAPVSERTPTMVSVEARRGVSTGISSADRAETIRRLVGPSTGPQDLVSPGHVFPLVAAEGGLLERHGRLQAAVDVMRLAGLEPAATLCDVLEDRGDLAGGEELGVLARRLAVPFISIGELADDRCDDVWSRC